MSERLHGRKVVFDVGQPGELATSITGLPIVFDIAFKLDGKPNAGQIAIKGAARDLYGAAQRKGAVVRLLAGYTTPKLIFVGNPIPKVGARYYHDGGSRTLDIQALDAGNRYAVSYLDLSLDGPTTGLEIMRAAATQLAIPLGPLPAELATLTFGNGFHASGKVDRVLDRLGLMAGFAATTRDGALLAIPNDGDSGEVAPVLSTESGNLLNLQLQKDGTIEYRALLDGSIRPGRRVVFEHPDFSGVAKARDTRFYGDPGWDTPFYTEGTARRVG